jgi:hypothetical protein
LASSPLAVGEYGCRDRETAAEKQGDQSYQADESPQTATHFVDPPVWSFLLASAPRRVE